MRAVVCTRAIFSRFTKNTRMRAPISWEPVSGHLPEKASCQKFTMYTRDRHALILSAGLLLFTVFVFLVCMIDTVRNVMEQQSLLVESSTGLARPRRALQSSSQIDFDARQKVGALHGLGVTFRTGTRPVNELVLAHLVEETTAEELRIFLRTLHRSGVTARSDIVLLFPWSLTSDIIRVIDEEESSFQLLMSERRATSPPHKKKNFKPVEEFSGQNIGETNSEQLSAPEIHLFPSSNATISPFNAKAFWKSKEERKVGGEMLWENTTANLGRSESNASMDWADWGSIVGFEMQDLDQDEVLHGFIEDPPAQLRRWICYQMLLGMMKSKYRSVVLTDVRGVFILRDVFSTTRRKTFHAGLNLFKEDLSWKDVHRAQKKRLGTSVVGSSHGISSSILKDQDFPSKMTMQRQADSDEGNVPQLSEENAMREARRIEIARHHMQSIEEVYGKDAWKSLDKDDKEKATLCSGFIIGNMKPIRSLSTAMLTEIAALALKRKTRQPFHDGAVLNYLVQKSSILNRRVTDKLNLLSNSDAPVHSLPGSKQPSVFLRDNGHGYAALIGLKEELMTEGKAWTITQSIQAEICSSQTDSRAYGDCSPLRSTV